MRAWCGACVRARDVREMHTCARPQHGLVRGEAGGAAARAGPRPLVGAYLVSPWLQRRWHPRVAHVERQLRLCPCRETVLQGGGDAAWVACVELRVDLLLGRATKRLRCAALAVSGTLLATSHCAYRRFVRLELGRCKPPCTLISACGFGRRTGRAAGRRKRAPAQVDGNGEVLHECAPGDV